MTTHFTHLHEHRRETLVGLVRRAIELKKSPPTDGPLAGKSVALVFLNPSLRTRTSMEIAAASLGAIPVVLAPGKDAWAIEHRAGAVMDGAAAEHAREAVGVLARYSQVIGLRAFPAASSWAEDRAEPMLAAFREHSAVPIVNLESASGHPCQALADLMTIEQRMEPAGRNFLLTWTPHVKALPLAVPHSAAEIAALAGMNVTIARPEGYDLAPEAMSRLRSLCAESGRRLRVTSDAGAAYDGAHVVYAKSWMSLERYGAPPAADERTRKTWVVDGEKMRRTERGIFMHCLPTRRNLEVSDGVIDSPASVVLDQAENRLHTAKAVLLWLCGERAGTR
jgi:N-acetylornithine carbamoyltransferase